MELQWWSIEVFDGAELSAARWQDSYGNALVEAAITHGAFEWQWHRHSWGVLFEIGFRSDERWPSYRNLPVVRAALDAVPDPINGLMVYPGRGGSSGRVEPRRPRPVAGAGAAPIPKEAVSTDVTLATGEPGPTGWGRYRGMRSALFDRHPKWTARATGRCFKPLHPALTWSRRRQRADLDR